MIYQIILHDNKVIRDDIKVIRISGRP